MSFGPYSPLFALQEVFFLITNFLILVQGVIAPLVGAGLGAWFAFRLESRSREKKERRRLLGIAKWELFRLATIWNWYHTFHKRTILSARITEVPGWQVRNSLKPSLPVQFTTPSPYEDLLAIGMNSAMILNLNQLIENYEQLQRNRVERERIWNDQIVMQLQGAGIKNAERLTNIVIEGIVGNAVYTMYLGLGEQLIAGTEAGLKQVASQYESTLRVIAESFPGLEVEAATFAYDIDVELEQLKAGSKNEKNGTEKRPHASGDNKPPDGT